MPAFRTKYLKGISLSRSRLLAIFSNKEILLDLNFCDNQMPILSINYSLPGLSFISAFLKVVFHITGPLKMRNNWARNLLFPIVLYAPGATKTHAQRAV